MSDHLPKLYCGECDRYERDPIFLDVERCSECGELIESEDGASSKEELVREALQILTNLHDNIAKHGNYSAESTMVFVDQAASCLREALA